MPQVKLFPSELTEQLAKVIEGLDERFDVVQVVESILSLKARMTLARFVATPVAPLEGVDESIVGAVESAPAAVEKLKLLDVPEISRLPVQEDEAGRAVPILQTQLRFDSLKEGFTREISVEPQVRVASQSESSTAPLTETVILDVFVGTFDSPLVGPVRRIVGLISPELLACKVSCAAHPVPITNTARKATMM